MPCAAIEALRSLRHRPAGCGAEGLRITQTMTLMTIGLYNQPEGVWLPSVSY